MAAVRVDNFVVWLCVDDRNEETDCGTPNDPVLEITTVKDGDGDSADDANNTGDDTGWYSDNDDWLATDGDTAECVVGIYDGDGDRDGDDIDKDDDNNDDVSTVSGKVDEETEGSGALSIKNKKDWTKELTKLTEFSNILYYNIATVIIIIIIINLLLFLGQRILSEKCVAIFKLVAIVSTTDCNNTVWITSTDQ